MDWSLYRCGTSGHLTYAPDEPELRSHLRASAGGTELWRCLRCGSFVPGLPHGAGPAADAPNIRRGREIRGEIILRFFAVERLIRFVVISVGAFLVWQFRTSQESLQETFNHKLPVLRDLFRQLGFNIDKSRLAGLVNHALHVSPRFLMWLAIGLAAFAIVELIEGIGLWLAKRWGEYFAMIVTSLGLPYEVYDITAKFTWTRLILMLINIALVLYLVLSRRLFGIRGGKAAYEARLRSLSVIDEATKAAAARQADLAAAPGLPQGSRQAAGAALASSPGGPGYVAPDDATVARDAGPVSDTGGTVATQAAGGRDGAGGPGGLAAG